MKYFKSIFIKPNEKPYIVQSNELKSIYDPNSQSVHIDDIKNLIKSEFLKKTLFNKPTSSLLEELKILYSVHMMLFADQITDIDQIIVGLKQGNIIYKRINGPQYLLTQIIQKSQGQQLQTIYDLNTSEAPVQATNSEMELAKLYYSYLQRLTANFDIYQSAQKSQYPYPDDNLNRRVQFLWMFKLINLINFKLTMIPIIQKMQIVQDIATLIYKDSVNEYSFLKKEIEEIFGFYSQLNVKDAISFYELFLQLKYITINLKLFHNLRSYFIKHDQNKGLEWFQLDKKQEKDIETYIQKAKIINSQQFRNSLQVPSQQAAYEHLQKLLLQPKFHQKV